MDYSVRIEELYKSYPSGNETLEVLTGLDGKIPAGASLVITGDSGCGKTTLLHLLAAMDRPSSGRIEVQGLNLAQASERELNRYRNRTIGLVFQFHNLLREFTALENIMLPARMAGLDEKAARERALVLLADVGLSERSGHFPTQLSGGERQRVALARALINDPPLVLADEPTGNLDEKNARMVEGLLFELSARYHKTLVLVTHNSKLASDGSLHWNLKGGKIQGQEENNP